MRYQRFKHTFVTLEKSFRLPATHVVAAGVSWMRGTGATTLSVRLARTAARCSRIWQERHHMTVLHVGNVSSGALALRLPVNEQLQW